MSDQDIKATAQTMSLPAIEARRLTEAECIAVGGHCWVEGVYTRKLDKMERDCRHCGRHEVGTLQPSVLWETA